VKNPTELESEMKTTTTNQEPFSPTEQARHFEHSASRARAQEAALVEQAFRPQGAAKLSRKGD